ncbi:MAG TPA: DUF6779 domain-containing protein [Pseudonocardiaceae bacterium]
MIGPQEPPLRYARGRVLVFGSCVLAVTAAAVLALGADDARLLRLGIVAALWAALIGTFTTARARREPDSAGPGEPRERAERSDREDIVALRSELQSLRETLRSLLGGNLLVERVALRTESTRLRPLSGSHAVADRYIRIPDPDAVTGTAHLLPAAAEVSPPAQREPVEATFGPGGDDALPRSRHRRADG